MFLAFGASRTTIVPGIRADLTPRLPTSEDAGSARIRWRWDRIACALIQTGQATTCCRIMRRPFLTCRHFDGCAHGHFHPHIVKGVHPIQAACHELYSSVSWLGRLHVLGNHLFTRLEQRMPGRLQRPVRFGSGGGQAYNNVFVQQNLHPATASRQLLSLAMWPEHPSAFP